MMRHDKEFLMIYALIVRNVFAALGVRMTCIAYTYISTVLSTLVNSTRTST